MNMHVLTLTPLSASVHPQVRHAGLVPPCSVLQVNMPELALLRFVVLDDDYIGDDFIGQYTVPFECLQPGYRSVPLLGIAGDLLPHSSLFVHVAITNRRGGGKAQRRGLSVRRVGKRGREYVTLRHTGIKVVDEAFKPAGVHLKEATDLREDAQVGPVLPVNVRPSPFFFIF